MSVITHFPLAEPELTDEQVALRDEIKLKAREMEELFEKLRDTRSKIQANLALEGAVLWAERGLV